MMLCDTLCAVLDDYVDNVLPGPVRQQVDEHVLHCLDCRRRVRDAVSLQEALRALREPEPSPDVVARQFRQLWAKTHLPVRRSHYLPVVAATALLVGLLLGGGLMYWSSHPGAASEMVTVELHDTSEVRFAVNAKRDLSGVRLTVQLPANMELVGYPGQRELVWTTSLKQGTNLLSLPLKATGEGKGEVVMLIESPSGLQTRRTFLVNTRGNRTSSVSFSSMAGSGLI